MSKLKVEGQPSAFRSTSIGMETDLKLGSVLAYQINWNQWLCDCDEILSYTIECALPVTDKEVIEDAVTFKVAGETKGFYPLICRIETFEGLKEAVTLYWNVV